jgi:hypothetical protein
MIKKIFILKIFILFYFFALSNNVLAASISGSNLDLKLIDVIFDSNKNLTVFNMNIQNLEEINNINWKIRAQCKGIMSIKLENKDSNLCYSERKIELKDNSFSFNFKNRKKVKNFSIILQGYDNKGVLKYSEKENFK